MTEGVRTSLIPGGGDAPLVGLDALPDGVPFALDAQIDGVAESLVLHRSGERVRAWLNICPHAGRRLDWAPGRFLLSKTGQLVCAAHGATFELDAGECVAGPCRGQSLRAVPVAVVDGAVRLA
jgi:nitrite reductase/ring-hydroxylating ferredoxin subunit